MPKSTYLISTKGALNELALGAKKFRPMITMANCYLGAQKDLRALINFFLGAQWILGLEHSTNFCLGAIEKLGQGRAIIKLLPTSTQRVQALWELTIFRPWSSGNFWSRSMKYSPKLEQSNVGPRELINFLLEHIIENLYLGTLNEFLFLGGPH